MTDPAVWDMTEVGKDNVHVQWQAPMGELYLSPLELEGKAIPSAVENYLYNSWDTKRSCIQNFLVLGGFYWAY